MSKTIDMITQKFGMWTVLERRGVNKQKAPLYLCRCDCGTESLVVGYSLRRGDSTNCGCQIGKRGRESVDLSGKRFGRWEVLSRGENDKRGQAQYNCRCTCGTEKVVAGYSLRRGESKSCGCLSVEVARGRKGCKNPGSGGRKHGMKGTPEYSAWSSMKGRCTNPKYENYKNYGGRGISVCQEWHTFENFYRDMGARPEGTSLDRIDVNGNYEPSNCRWGTEEEQCNNRTNARLLEFNGKKQTIAQWSRELGIKYRTIHQRLRMKWSIKDTLTKEIEVHKCHPPTTNQ